MTAENENTTQANFAIQRIYVKDLSFETPSAPDIFLQQWKPDLNVELKTKSKALGKDTYEVELTVTATVQSEKKVAFLVEVTQAGIFSISEFPQAQIEELLGSFCPGILFPYARQCVSDMVTKGSFPQLVLAPVNFDVLYQQQLQQKAEENSSQKKSEIVTEISEQPDTVQ